MIKSTTKPAAKRPLPALYLFSPLKLFSRRYIISTMLVLLGMAVMVRLGFWQLDRLAQRRAANAELVHQLNLPPLPLTGPQDLPADLSTLSARTVVAQGRYDLDRQMILLSQVHQNTAGVHLITPLVIGDGSQAVLVDRGWMSYNDNAPEQWADFDETGPVAAEGFAQLSQTLPNAQAGQSSTADASAFQREWYRVDIEAIQPQLPYELLPVFIVQTAAEGQSHPDRLVRFVPHFDLSEGPHLGYAIQWGIFALILGLGYLYYVGKQLNTEANKSSV